MNMKRSKALVSAALTATLYAALAIYLVIVLMPDKSVTLIEFRFSFRQILAHSACATAAMIALWISFASNNRTMALVGILLCVAAAALAFVSIPALLIIVILAICGFVSLKRIRLDNRSAEPKERSAANARESRDPMGIAVGSIAALIGAAVLGLAIYHIARNDSFRAHIGALLRGEQNVYTSSEEMPPEYDYGGAGFDVPGDAMYESEGG